MNSKVQTANTLTLMCTLTQSVDEHQLISKYLLVSAIMIWFLSLGPVLLEFDVHFPPLLEETHGTSRM